MGNMRLFTILNALLLFAQITSNIAQVSQPRKRLLTPEEGCGISKIANTKIIGGSESKRGAFPWMATIGYEDAEGKAYFGCGASLITSRHVLTAAHCVDINREYVVGLGEHDITDNEDKDDRYFRVIHVDIHPNYTSMAYLGDGRNDIAILTLELDVEFNDRIRPICLPMTEELKSNSFVGTNPFVAGWGLLKKGGEDSNVLMQVQIPVIDNAVCKHLYKKKFLLILRYKFTEAVICAGNLDGGQDACKGDSGGPLMLPILHNGEFPMYQIGIVSWGLGCGQQNTPGVYSRVSHFMDWIQEKIAK